MKKLRRASILGATILCITLFDQPVMAEIKVNRELCSPLMEQDCQTILVKVATDRLRIRRTRITCKDSSGYTKSTIAEGNINDGDSTWMYLDTASCIEYKLDVKGSFYRTQTWNKCDHWKNHSSNWITTGLENGTTRYTLNRPTGGFCTYLRVNKACSGSHPESYSINNC